jgi:hypothetical protein
MANPNPLPPPEHSRWRKGTSGNPAGRPRGRSVTERLLRLLESDRLDGVELAPGTTIAHAVAETLIREALKGKHQAMAMLLDRCEGRVAPSIKPVEGAALAGPTVVFYIPHNGRDGAGPAEVEAGQGEARESGEGGPPLPPAELR